MVQNRTVRVCNGCHRDITSDDGNYFSLVYMGDLETPWAKLTLSCKVTQNGMQDNLDVCNRCMVALMEKCTSELEERMKETAGRHSE